VRGGASAGIDEWEWFHAFWDFPCRQVRDRAVVYFRQDFAKDQVSRHADKPQPAIKRWGGTLAVTMRKKAMPSAAQEYKE